jgi:UDP-N-acetylglucosamine diphosphorylase/glucosamine-1-phosphate N-acetyltransferase
MRLCIFEDLAHQLEPFSLTRPVFDLRSGLTTLAEKQRRQFLSSTQGDLGVLIRPHLADLFRQENPGVPCNDDECLRGDDVLLVNGRWLPPGNGVQVPSSPCAGMVDDQLAFVVVKKAEAPSWSLDELPNRLRGSLDRSPPIEAGGRMVSYPWDLVHANNDEIRRDFSWLPPCDLSRVGSPELLGPGGQLWIAPSARIEPLVVADTTRGPVVIDEEALITSFTRLEGPCYIGARSQIHGAKIRAGTSIGAQCRVGGEVEASILHGYANKYHEGFLGHSYVGEWVNLGAGTHNSDLRNDYGEVSVIMDGRSVATGLNKVGCFLGDHTKTGLGTLFNTGTNVGAFCNLLPAGRFAPKYVPNFTSWWNGALSEAFTLEQLLATADIVMNRRGVALTKAHKALYLRLFEATAAERRRAMRAAEQRQLRKSA